MAQIQGKDVCEIRVENGQANLYMPDGTKIPEQVDLTFQQLLRAAVDSPARGYATIRVLAIIADSVRADEIGTTTIAFDK